MSRRLDLGKGRVVWLDHVIAEFFATTRDTKEQVLVLFFGVPIMQSANVVGVDGSPEIQQAPWQMPLTPDETRTYLAAVAPLTLLPGGDGTPRAQGLVHSGA